MEDGVVAAAKHQDDLLVFPFSSLISDFNFMFTMLIIHLSMCIYATKKRKGRRITQAKEEAGAV